MLSAAACAVSGSRRAGDGFGQFGLGLGVLEFRGLVLRRLFGLLLGVEGLGFVEVLAADGGVGQDAHQVRLHFEHAAGGRLVLRTGR